MYLRLLKRVFSIHKLELLIMPALKFGEIILMITKVIFGAWAVLYMKWLL